MLDIEALMDIVLQAYKDNINAYVDELDTEKGDDITSKWKIDSNAFYLDALNDFPPYEASLLVFLTGNPVEITQERQEGTIAEYTIGVSVLLSDNFKDEIYRAQKRYCRALKKVITKNLMRKYINNNIKYLRKRLDVITSPQGTMYQVSAVFFSITILE